jgi:hypothetical protein
MRRWKRIVAILLVATLAFVIEGWASSAQGAEAVTQPVGVTAVRLG